MADKNRLAYLDELSPKTKETYSGALKNFFKSIGFGGDNLNETVNQYFSEQRDYGEDLKQFLQTVNERPPKTQHLYLSTMRTFFVENEVELPSKYWRTTRRRIRGSRARTMDKVPVNGNLKKIIMHMPVHGKALYLMLASSGMRIGEALSLETDDVYLDEKPVRVNIRGEHTKSGNPRVTFISSETKEFLEEYLKYRNNYITSKRTRYEKVTEDQRLFPFTSTTALVIWQTAIDKSGFNERDKSTNLHVYHPHTLRKFFRSRMSTVIHIDIVEELMGHEGYLTNEYRRHTTEELAEAYLKGESSVTVFGYPDKVKELEEKLDTKDKEVRAIISGLVTENMALKQRINVVEGNWKKFEVIYQDLVKKVGEIEAQNEIMRLWIEQDKKQKELEEEQQKNAFEATRE
jgi:integrase